MPANPIPTPPIDIKEPALDVPVLDFWAGVYDHVFFALNPAFRIPWTDALPERLRIAEDGADYVRPCAEAWDVEGVDMDRIIRQHGEAFTWAEEHQRLAPGAAFPDFARTYWLATVWGSTHKDCDPSVAQAIMADQNSAFFPPDENELPPIMAAKVGAFFAAMGCNRIDAYDEFRLHGPESLTPEALQDPDVPLLMQSGRHPWRIGCLHAPDPGAVMIWSFDDTSATIGMTGEAFRRADPADHFECFRATPEMRPDWLRQLAAR